METILQMITRHEGSRAHTYNDSLGIPTCGVGFNLRRPDARQCLTDVGADYDLVLAGKQDLTQDQIDKLLEKDIDACTADLTSLFPSFPTFPQQVQLALTDIRFNLGPNRFRGFHNAIACIQNQDWAGAATQFLHSVWATQVKSRATDDCGLLQNT